MYPATISDKELVAVGGTTLTKNSSARGWTDTVWVNSGSGCSEYETKAEWQTVAGCEKRLTNDVSIVAENVFAYDSYETTEKPWITMAGTSIGAPLIAGILAHASKEVRENPNKAFYKDLEEGIGTVIDVTSGNNNPLSAMCTYKYECEAETGEDGNSIKGYDGPTGVGVPTGPPTLAKWSKQTLPSTGDGYLESMACSSTTACTAVGVQSNKTLAERWNGGAWSVETTPNQSEPDGLRACRALAPVHAPQ